MSGPLLIALRLSSHLIPKIKLGATCHYPHVIKRRLRFKGGAHLDHKPQRQHMVSLTLAPGAMPGFLTLNVRLAHSH